MENYQKYHVGYFNPPICNYKWVKKDHITKAPKWCSVDLRDGNQALVVPMNLEQKIGFFKYLVELGFKEIEVGFPAASETEYEFLRELIDNDLVPDDVTLQVLTQSREHIIDKTFSALKGAKRAIVHLYNSTSFAQRQQVFRATEDEIVQIALDGARLMNKYRAENPETDFTFQYSPESFTGTEVEFALRICNEVIKEWNPTPDNKVIINLPATVEMSMPHVFANQIEYMSDNLLCRENVVLSIHPHNDRGTGVASAELALLAGGDRIEGTLFGNGERTGNVDIVTLALNLFTHGVDPELDFSDMPKCVKSYEEFTGMTVGPRQPYGGELVFTAFSGSHQDAISKGMKWREEVDPNSWTTPYLPLDPKDIGRQYDGDVIRINSQSGKGGVAYILEHNFGFVLPKAMRSEVGYMIKDISDKQHEELSPEDIFSAFSKEYINDFSSIDITDAVFEHLTTTKDDDSHVVKVDMNVVIAGNKYKLKGEGNGRLDAVSQALKKTDYNFDYEFITYSEHAISTDSTSKAATYICISDPNGNSYWGIGTHADIVLASVNALVSALNRMNKVRGFVK